MLIQCVDSSSFGQTTVARLERHRLLMILCPARTQRAPRLPRPLAGLVSRVQAHRGTHQRESEREREYCVCERERGVRPDSEDDGGTVDCQRRCL